MKMNQMEEFQQQVEASFIDPDLGLVYSYIDPATRKPATDAFFEQYSLEKWLRLPDVSIAEFQMHEDCGMTTGAYCQALVQESLNHGKSAWRMARIRRCIKAFFHVMEIGCSFEDGFFPKVYGGHLSNQTSSDQVLYACAAMDAAWPLLEAAEQKQISEAIGKLVGFWVRRDYRFHYFNAFGDDWQWPLTRFPALLLLAWRHTGDEIFRREYERLLPYADQPENPQLWNAMNGKRGLPGDDEQHFQGWMVAYAADCFSMSLLSYDILLRLDPDHPRSECWRDAMRKMWFDVRDSFSSDGRYYSFQLFDLKSFSPKRIPAEAITKMVNAGSKCTWSTLIARGALQMARHVPEVRAAALAMTDSVVKNLHFDAMRQYDEPERLGPELRARTILLSGDSATNYLWSAALAQAERGV